MAVDGELAKWTDIMSSIRKKTDIMETLSSSSRYLVIDSVATTISLGVYTFIAAATVYIVVSRRWNDAVGAIILLSVLPNCLSTLTTWIGILSQLAQLYALLETDILGVTNVINAFANAGKQCAAPGNGARPPPSGLADDNPTYSGHGCVGTAVITANVVTNVAVLLVSMGVFLRGKPGRKSVYATILLVPFLPGCVSAVMHVRSVCYPGTGPRGRERFVPQSLDSTTYNLLQISRYIALAIFVYMAWMTREEYYYLRDSAARIHWIRCVVFVYVVPRVARIGWIRLHKAYSHEPSSVLRHVLFSAGDALFYPLMKIYPGIVILLWRLHGGLSET
ncbi:hypothetical protein C8Q77DRAFT_1095267 [Trametes polyzona]|nr:hypothetical protein C8Q77DRAFT_1095267 [Trametes polyzona]